MVATQPGWGGNLYDTKGVLTYSGGFSQGSSSGMGILYSNGLKSALELYAADFAADGLRQLVAELYRRDGLERKRQLHAFYSRYA